MTKRKMVPRLFSVALVLCLVVALAVPGFANAAGEPSQTVSPSGLLRRLGDTDHAFHFRLNRTPVSNDLVLNCATENIQPPDGTKISLWTATGSETQAWYIDNTAINVTTAIRPNTNRALALNADRSGIGSICNVIKSSSNVYNDYQCTLVYGAGEGSQSVPKIQIRLPARLSHVNPVFITYSSQGNYCRWQYNNSQSYWFMADGPTRP